MGYNLLLKGIYWGYNHNPLTSLLLTSWHIQVWLVFMTASKNTKEKSDFTILILALKWWYDSQIYTDLGANYIGGATSTPAWGNDPIWPKFLKRVETTN